MTVKIRLARWGQRNNPFYGVVVANAHASRDGRHLERVGTYSPIPDANKVKHIELNFERIQYWLGVGAQPTDRVAYLLAKAGIMPLTPIQQQRQGVLSLGDRKTWKVRITDPNTGLERVVTQEDARKIVVAGTGEGKFLARVAAEDGDLRSRKAVPRLLERAELDAFLRGEKKGGAKFITEKKEGAEEVEKAPAPAIGGVVGVKPKAGLLPRERLLLLKEYMGVY
ncbi:ribosomal protein S16 domain-containing protein [Chytriomyces sp. MP71]|nr:ribosomal protein S16 domain-containing protein [Chytriomyces sp. MP71]